MVGPVGAGDPAAGPVDAEVGDHRDAVALVAHRAEEPLHQTGVRGEVGCFEQPPARREARLAVPGNEEDGGGTGVVQYGEALQDVPGGDIAVGKVLDHPLHAGAPGGVVFGHGREVGRLGLPVCCEVGQGLIAGPEAGAPLGRLDIGCVLARGAAHEEVLAHSRGNHELVVDLPADRPRLRLDRGGVQAEPLEDPHVGVIDNLVGSLHGLHVHVEGVGVAHDQLAGAKQPEPGPGLVAEFDLDLVDGEGQLPIGVDLCAHGGGRHLLVGGTEHEGATPALDGEGGQGVGAEERSPPALLPQLQGVQRGEEDLLASRPIELLPDDLLQLVEHPEPEGHEGVHPRGEPPDVAAPDQQLMAGHLGVGRRLAEGTEQEP